MNSKEKLALYLCASDFAISSLKSILSQEKINYASAEVYLASLPELVTRIKQEYSKIK